MSDIFINDFRRGDTIYVRNGKILTIHKGFLIRERETIELCVLYKHNPDNVLEFPYGKNENNDDYHYAYFNRKEVVLLTCRMVLIEKNNERIFDRG
jgi:hypothetical protein